jgi:hypothetical protein
MPTPTSDMGSTDTRVQGLECFFDGVGVVMGWDKAEAVEC